MPPKKPKKPKTKSTRVVCFEVVEAPSTHDLSHDPEKEARRIGRGDVVRISLTPPKASKATGEWILNSAIGNPRTVFIHVEEVPDSRWQSLRRSMQDRIWEIDGDENSRKVRSRKWRVNIKDLPPGPRTKLLNQRQCTMQWDIFRQDLVKKQVHDPAKPQDDTDTPIEDSDIPEATL